MAVRTTMAALIARVRLLDMFPKSSMPYRGDGTGVNAIVLSKFFGFTASARSGSNSKYIVFSKLGTANCLPLGLSVLVIAILRIVGTRAQKQVVRTNTGRNVAMMTDRKIIRDRPIRQFIRIAMRSYCAAFVSLSEKPMPKASFAACPNPAISSFINLCPESNGDVFAVSNVRTGFRTVVADLCRLPLKRFSTDDTCTLNLVHKPLSTASRSTKTLNWIASPWSRECFSAGLARKFDRHKFYLQMFDISLYHSARCSRQNKTKVLGGISYGC